MIRDVSAPFESHSLDLFRPPKRNEIIQIAPMALDTAAIKRRTRNGHDGSRPPDPPVAKTNLPQHNPRQSRREKPATIRGNDPWIDPARRSPRFCRDRG